MAFVFTVLDDVLFQNQNCPLPTSPVRVDINSLSTEKARHAAVRFPSACPVLLRLDGVGPLVALVFVSSWRHSQDCQGCCPMAIYRGLGEIICKESVAFGVCGGERRPRHEATLKLLK